MKTFTPFCLRIGAPLVPKACWPVLGSPLTPLLSRYSPLFRFTYHWGPLLTTSLHFIPPILARFNFLSTTKSLASQINCEKVRKVLHAENALPGNSQRAGLRGGSAAYACCPDGHNVSKRRSFGDSAGRELKIKKEESGRRPIQHRVRRPVPRTERRTIRRRTTTRVEVRGRKCAGSRGPATYAARRD